MDATEYRQNCIQKAIEEGSRYGVSETEPNVYYCRSGKSGSVYRLEHDRREGWRCECESSAYRGFCKHIAGLLLFAERNGIALPKVAVPQYTLGGKPLT